MTEFASGQDKANPLFGLATRAGKMATSCPLVISRACPARTKFSFDHEIILPLSSGSKKTQEFYSNNALEGKKRNWDLPFFGQEKLEVQALKVFVQCRTVLL